MNTLQQNRLAFSTILGSGIALLLTFVYMRSFWLTEDREKIYVPVGAVQDNQITAIIAAVLVVSILFAVHNIIEEIQSRPKSK